MVIFPKYGVDTFRKYLMHMLRYLTEMGNSKDTIKGKTLNAKIHNYLLIPISPLVEQECINGKLEDLQ